MDSHSTVDQSARAVVGRLSQYKILRGAYTEKPYRGGFISGQKSANIQCNAMLTLF